MGYRLYGMPCVLVYFTSGNRAFFCSLVSWMRPILYQHLFCESKYYMQNWHKNFDYNIRWDRNETWFTDYSNTETFDYFPYKPSSQTSQTLDQNLTRDWDEAESIASFSIKFQIFPGFYAKNFDLPEKKFCQQSFCLLLKCFLR